MKLSSLNMFNLDLDWKLLAVNQLSMLLGVHLCSKMCIWVGIENVTKKFIIFQPIKFRGDVRLNVEEKKTRAAREGDRRDIRPRGPGGPRDKFSGGVRGPPSRGGVMSQKPSFGAGRGAGPSEGRYMGPRQ